MQDKQFAVVMKAYGMVRTIFVRAASAAEAKREANRSTSIGKVVGVREVSAV